MSTPQCGAIKADGTPCRHRQRLSKTNGLCLFHDPDRREERREFQSRRKRVPKPKPPTTVEEVVAARAWLLQELLANRIKKEEAGILRAVLADQERSITSSLKGDLKEMKALLESLKKEVKK